MKPAYKNRGKLRIIGGEWRGRRLSIAAEPSLRPTPDRVRETLFNWLNPHLSGAHCLDLFAGTGALGFEALSRGAAAVDFVENDRACAALLDEHKTMLDAGTATVVESDVFRHLAQPPTQAFDIVFLDPPYALACLIELSHLLCAGWLKPHAQVYLEAQKIPILDLEAAGLTIVRQGRTRQVHYALAEVASQT